MNDAESPSDDGIGAGFDAIELGMARCSVCGTLGLLDTEPQCVVCGSALHARRPNSLQRTWALLLMGLVAYIPANLVPIMHTSLMGSRSSDTILSGVASLAAHGSWFVAAVVAVASLCIPLAKFGVIGYLAWKLTRHDSLDGHSAHRLHAITEFIGRWSMVDVFVVAVLAALIQLGIFVNIEPGQGIGYFAASVVFTMLAATALDTRLAWDEVVHD